MRFRGLAPFASMLVAGVAFVSQPARAYEERLLYEVGAAPSLGLYDGVSPGASATFGVSKGIGTSWSIGGSLRYGWYQTDPGAHRLAATFDVMWQLDIVRWVPRIAFGAGPAIVFDASPPIGLASHVDLGIDRLTDFGFFGFDLRLDGYGPSVVVDSARIATSLAFRIGWLVDRF